MKKRNLIIIILSAIFLVIAIVMLVVGFIIKDGSILWWFTSKWAMWFYVLAGLYLLVIAGVLITDKIRSL